MTDLGIWPIIPRVSTVNKVRAQVNVLSQTLVEDEQLLREKVRGLQQKLLNLTLRNKLLNFSHNERTRGFVRVVDELPNTLYRTLATSTMRMLSLPDLPRPEDSPEFEQALEFQRLTNPEYLAKIEADPGDDVEASDRLEEWLRQSVRTSLGIRTNSKPIISIVEHARSQGIRPDFELPRESPTGSVEKWVDDRIQLLLTPEGAERRLSQLLDLATESQKEQGVNTLFAAFGFLQWKEDDSSDKLLQAPLLMLPVQLKREVKDHQYCYSCTSEGLEPDINQTLLERLWRDFKFRLPNLEEEDTPETYWAKVESIVETRRGWKVHRWVTFGIFPFGKMAMYNDLDAANWPEDSPLYQHRLLQDVLLGQHPDAGLIPVESFARLEEYETKSPLLVTDCDSSQFGAIVRCLGSGSAVIQGPPGTGKSQTITNLIAAAIAEGQTVLFVAEKMAALEVVSSRLDAAGLGAFTFALHSDSVLKSEVMASIKERLEFPQPDDSHSRWTEHLGRVSEARNQLNCYADLMNSPFARTGQTVHEILWRSLALNADNPSLPPKFLAAKVEGPDTWTKDNIDRFRFLASSAQTSYAQLRRDGFSVHSNPWRGLSPKLRTPIEINRIKASVEQHITLLEESRASYDLLKPIFSPAPQRPGKILSNLRESLKSLGSPSTLLGLISRTSITRESPDGWLEVAGRMTRLRKTEAVIVSNLGNEPLAISLSPLLAEMKGDVQSLPGQIANLVNVQQRLQNLISLEEQIAQISPELRGLNLQKVDLVKRAAALAASLSSEASGERNRLKFGNSSRRLLTEAHKGFSELVAREAELASDLNLDQEVSDLELDSAVVAFREAHLFSWLFPSYRSAERLWRRLHKAPKNRTRPERSSLLQTYEKLRKDQRLYDTEPRFSETFGSVFVGRRTLFPLLEELVSYEERTEKTFIGIDSVSKSLKKVLLQGDSDVVSFLGSLGADQRLDCSFSQDMESTLLLPQLLEATESKIRDYQFVQLKLKQLEAVDGQMDLRKLSHLPEQISSYREDQESIGQDTLIPKLFAGGLSPGLQEAEALVKGSQYILQSRQFGLNEEFTSACFGPDGQAHYENAVERIAKASVHHEGVLAHWTVFAREELDNARIFFDGRLFDDLSFEECLTRFAECKKYHHQLTECSRFAECLSELEKCRFGPVLAECLKTEDQFVELSKLLDVVIWNNLADSVHHLQGQLLNRHSGSEHDRLRQDFRELDRSLLEVNKQAIVQRLLTRSVPAGNGRGRVADKTERALLEHVVGKPKSRVSIRDLVSRASGALQALKPCFMMSPLSVSQLLTPGRTKFDLLIVDEASQMTPEDALAAICRCTRMVVVGDQQQLPPSNFFGVKADENSEDDEDALDSEAILDLAQGVYYPPVDLRWHYRSRMASLITFSNHHFYEGRLQIFPSPKESDPNFGVKLHRVAGVYKAGLNPAEALAVIEHTVGLMKNFPNKSIGIVALNQKQREYIHELMERRISEEDAALAYEQKWSSSLEPFFVKNLENVQGDERDIIVISTVYGPDENGVVAQRFGPINQSAGHRRLNVLFTRAKYSTQIFSTMSAQDIRTKADSGRGVVALKNYLAYAETGSLQDYQLTGRPPDSDFEVSVARDLQNMGYEVAAQIGAGGYFIDLGIKHPSYPQEFLAGIECDGASYHSSKYARDRDRLRQQVLEGLGWNIIRIWSTDYFRNRDAAMLKVQSEIRAILDSKPPSESLVKVAT